MSGWLLLIEIVLFASAALLALHVADSVRYRRQGDYEEYVSTLVADLTDDVDVSMSSLRDRDSTLCKIESRTREGTLARWVKEAQDIAEEIGMASGAPYNYERSVRHEHCSTPV